MRYFYPRPPGGGRPAAVAESAAAFAISIHALRVEGDGLIVPKRPVKLHFYPRPPGGGRRCVPVQAKCLSNFYPRPPGGGRRLHRYATRLDRHQISIHALRVEGDRSRHRSSCRRVRFLSTPSGWRATSDYGIILYKEVFLSTPSGWRATIDDVVSTYQATFLSTPSGWRATAGPLHHAARRVDFYPRPPGGGRRACMRQ